MLRFTVALLTPYSLLAFNVSFFSNISFNIAFSNADFYVEILIFLFLDNFFLYVTLIKYSFPLFSPKEILYQFVVWWLIVNFPYLFDLFKQNKLWQVCNFGFYICGFNIFDHLKIISLEMPLLSRNPFGIKKTFN